MVSMRFCISNFRMPISRAGQRPHSDAPLPSHAHRRSAQRWSSVHGGLCLRQLSQAAGTASALRCWPGRDANTISGEKNEHHSRAQTTQMSIRAFLAVLALVTMALTVCLA
jgi:hypothetical protein